MITCFIKLCFSPTSEGYTNKNFAKCSFYAIKKPISILRKDVKYKALLPILINRSEKHDKLLDTTEY